MGDAPANGYCHGLGGAGTGTYNLRLQAVGLKHVQEGITGRHRPCERRQSTNPETSELRHKPESNTGWFDELLTGISTISNDQHP